MIRFVQTLFLTLSLAHAQNEASPDLLIGEPPSSSPPAEAQVDALTLMTAKKLRCPVCQGLSVADSPAEGAKLMKNRIHEFVAAGYSDDQICTYFVSRYGEWVLLEPPREGIHWLLWLSPFGLLALGGVSIVGLRTRKPQVALAAAPAPQSDLEAKLLSELDP
jgi:cytochrome c-type biogenesis protein CcmH